jgi:hypothetical protein
LFTRTIGGSTGRYWTSTYQAVTLLNGEVLYGRIDHLGSDHPVLRDAFVVRSEADAQSKAAGQSIVRRRDGPTGADHIILSATAIASVEPIAADSTLGRLMKDASLLR